MNVCAEMSNRIKFISIKYKLVILFLLIFVTSCTTLHDDRLLGTYVSDKEATLKYLKDTGNYTNEYLDRIGKLLGKMKITYNKDNIAIVELDGDIRQEDFKIIKVSSDYAVIEYDQSNKYKIIFKDDGYWASGGIMPLPYMEKFKKIKGP